MKKSLITIFLSIIIISGFGQVKFFVEASANYSIIKKIVKSNDYNPQYSPSSGYSSYFITWSKLIENYDSKPGFDIFIGLQKNISQKFNMESGFGLSMINYKKEDETIFNNYTPNNPFNISSYGGISVGQPFGPISFRGNSLQNINKLGNTSILYLTIPINLNYLIVKNKLSFGLGLSPLVIIHSIQYRYYYGVDDGYFKYGKQTTSDGLTNFVLGVNLKIEYSILKKMWITAKYQHAFSPIYDKGARFAGDAKVRLIKLGLRYYL